MSNYINVLRRLERERRGPESTPVPPAPAPGVVLRDSHQPAPIIESRATPVTLPPVAPVPPAERTVIPLPTVAPPPPAAAPSARVVTSAAAERVIAPVIPPVPVAAPAERLAVVDASPRSLEHAADTRRARAFATETHPGIATLLDAIRLIANGRERRVVVFCGASNAEEVTTLADALVTHAERSGMRAFLATLTRTVNGSMIVPARGATMDAVLPVDLDAGTSVESLGRWVEQVGPASDLVVIAGPPLATSIDAALLACASDGLVIVAESEVTERAALQLAAERARIAGCKTLGVVMHGTKDRLPNWLRRLMGSRSESNVS